MAVSQRSLIIAFAALVLVGSLVLFEDVLLLLPAVRSAVARAAADAIESHTQCSCDNECAARARRWQWDGVYCGYGG